MRRFFLAAIALGFLISPSTRASEVTPLIARDLADLPGKEIAMLTVEFAPGEAESVHRHNAHVMVYVLEGSVEMQVEGSSAVTLEPGQTFYESPKDVHVVGRNASSTKRAKFLAVFVKDKGVPFVTPGR